VKEWSLEELGIRSEIVERDLSRSFNAEPEASIDDVMSALSNCGIGYYVVGGAVRSWLEGRPARDLDIAVTSSIEDAFAALQKFTSCIDFTLNEKFGLLYLNGDMERVDVAIMRNCGDIDGELDEATFRGGNSISDDALARDFTINTFYYCPLSKRVMNPYPEGARDLRSRELNLIMDDRKLSVDYMACIRFLQFMARGYTASPRISEILASKLDTDILKFDQFGKWMENYVPPEREYYRAFKGMMYSHAKDPRSHQRLDGWFGDMERD